MKRLSCMVLVVGVLLSVAVSAMAQMPVHGATLMQGGHEDRVGPRSLDNLSLSFVFFPSPDEDAVDQALGAELAYSFYAADGIALRLGLGTETWETDDSILGLDDVRVIPVGLSLLFCPAQKENSVPIHLEAGLRYLFVDADSAAGDFDNALAGIVGLGVSLPRTGEFSIGLFGGYQFDISESEGDMGEELSFAGVITRISLMAQF